MSAPNTIVLIESSGTRHEEAKAEAPLKPGHYLKRAAAGKVKKNDVLGGGGERLFAKEDYLQGKTINDAYATDDIVLIHVGVPGDVIYARLAAGAPAVADSTLLTSNGDGTFALANPDVNVYTNTAVSAAIGTSSTAEAAFDKSYTIPANSLQVGDVIHIRVAVKVTASNSTDTLTLRFKIGATTIIATAAVDVADNDVGFFDVTLTITAIGATGSFTASGTQGLGVPGTVTAKPFYLAATAIDTTVAQAITITGQMSASSAGNAVVLQQLTVDEGGITNDQNVAMAIEAVDNSAGAAEAFIRIRLL